MEQSCRREIEMAKKNCEPLGVEHLVIPLGFIHDYFKSSLLEGAESIPEGHYTAENMSSTVVPFRNGIMLSVAAGIAESRGLTRIMIANHGGDHAIYPDCRKEFIDAMNSAIWEGSGHKVEILAPYTCISKSDIAAIGKRIGVDYSLTYSCYKGGRSIAADAGLVSNARKP